MKTIRTERLRLEPVRPENAAVLWQVLQAPGLREFQDLPSVDVAQFRRTVAARPPELTPQAVGRFEWLIRFGSTTKREPLGWVSLRVADRSPTAGEIGYSVVNEQRGRGIASEAVRAILFEAFETARLRTVRAYCVPDNRASRQVLARNGFGDEKVMPSGAMVAGRPVDVVAYTLERQRWEALRAQSMAQ
jgi:RimJ/RimL family protein N-acetyltransferase